MWLTYFQIKCHSRVATVKESKSKTSQGLLTTKTGNCQIWLSIVIFGASTSAPSRSVSASKVGYAPRIALYNLLLLLTVTNARTLLADGSNMSYGYASPVLKWQASGVLYQGCGSNDADIGDCYRLSLTPNSTQQLDPNFPDSPRQRIEFRSENKDDGTTFKYTWKQHLFASTGTTGSFFHLMQVFSVKDSGPVVTLDATSGQIVVKDYFNNCPKNGCPSIGLSSYAGRVTLHTLTATFGPRGRLLYVVTDPNAGRTLLTYNVTGYMGSGGTYIKFGLYRLAVSGMTAADATCGDFTIRQI